MNSGWFIVGLISFLVIGIVAVLFFAGWQYGINLINTELLNVPSNSDMTNVSDATSKTFSYYNSSLSSLPIIAVVLLIGYFLGTLIIAYYSSDSPILIFLYLLVTAILFVFSIYVQNAYAEIQTDEVLGTTISGYGTVNFIISHLTTFLIVLAFIGMVLIVSGIMKGRQEYGV